MKKPLTILMLVLCIKCSYSQENRSARIEVFKGDNGGPKPVTKQDSAAGIDHNCIKWNYAVLLRGVFLINWEFRIKGPLTGEVGLGLAYRDFAFEFFHDLKDVNGNPIDWSNDGQPAIHLCGEGGLRYYFNGFDNFEGIYAEGTLSYRSYSFPNATDINTFHGTLVPGYKFLDAQFKLGYQATPYYSDFIYDCYIGFGYRSATLNYYTQNIDPNTGQITGTPQTTNEAFPQFLFGMQIGYSF